MCSIEFWFFLKNDLLPTLFASLTQKYWRAYFHSGICVHHLYIHNHDHVIPCHAIWKEVFEEVIFSSNIIKTLKSSRDGAERKKYWKKKEKGKEEEKEKEKLKESL
jgi:hypothetical protein